MTFFSAGIAALVTLAACAVERTQSVQPASRPTSAPTSPDPAVALLDRLETAGNDLRDFRADITYHLWDSMLERREIRGGEIVYVVSPNDGSRRFAILVTSVSVGNRRNNQNKRYVFDGSWFVEIDYDTRMFTKRQIVAPGERFDP